MTLANGAAAEALLAIAASCVRKHRQRRLSTRFKNDRSETSKRIVTVHGIGRIDLTVEQLFFIAQNNWGQLFYTAQNNWGQLFYTAQNNWGQLFYTAQNNWGQLLYIGPNNWGQLFYIGPNNWGQLFYIGPNNWRQLFYIGPVCACCFQISSGLRCSMLDCCSMFSRWCRISRVN